MKKADNTSPVPGRIVQSNRNENEEQGRRLKKSDGNMHHQQAIDINSDSRYRRAHRENASEH
jgi:hypothetical protein